MKKTLFSLAFLAASGGYVVYANHGLSDVVAGAVGLDETATAAVIAPQRQLSIDSALLDQAPQPSVTIAPRAVPRPVTTDPTPLLADAASTTPVAASFTPTPAPVVRTPVMPPLPRPRPTPPLTTETAQVAAIAPPSGPQYRDGTYTGTDENAYYGRVQVQIIVASNQITSIKPLNYPSDRRTSRYINGQALPLLRQEVMQAQSANIDAVSGATLTSEAYIKSLGNALRKAVGGNA